MTTQNRVSETINTYNKFAKNYQNKFMNMNLYDDTYDEFCSLINRKNPNILEIACGPGNITKYILSKRPDFRILGIDLAPNMIALAKENNPKANFKVMDCKEIGVINQKYDGIICGFCTPYLSKEDVKQLILDASKLLNSSGVFYLSTMEDDYRKSGFETTSFAENNKIFIYYHQLDYLTEMFVDAGFKIIKTQRKEYPEIDGTITIDLIITAKKI